MGNSREIMTTLMSKVEHEREYSKVDADRRPQSLLRQNIMTFQPQTSALWPCVGH